MDFNQQNLLGKNSRDFSHLSWSWFGLALGFFSLFSLGDSKVGLAQERVGRLIFLPQKGKSLVSLRTQRVDEEIEFDLFDQNRGDQKKEALLLKTTIGHSFTSSLHFGLSWDSYFHNKQRSTLQDQNLQEQETISQSKGWGDFDFFFIKRFPPLDQSAPVVGALVSYSPKVIEKKEENYDGPRALTRGGAKLGLGLRFGIKKGEHDSLSKFYLNYFFESEKKSLYKTALTRVDPHSELGFETTFQFFLSPLWKRNFYALLGGGIQLDTNHEVKKNISEEKATRGFTRKFGAGLSYDMNEAIVLRTLGEVKNSDYTLSLYDDEKEMDKEEVIASLELHASF